MCGRTRLSDEAYFYYFILLCEEKSRVEEQLPVLVEIQSEYVFRQPTGIGVAKFDKDVVKRVDLNNRNRMTARTDNIGTRAV